MARQSACRHAVCRVGGYAADALIVIGPGIAPDDLAANHQRVGGEAANEYPSTINASAAKPPTNIR